MSRFQRSIVFLPLLVFAALCHPAFTQTSRSLPAVASLSAGADERKADRTPPLSPSVPTAAADVHAQPASAAPPRNSQSSDWSFLGPDGGDVRSLAYDPRNPDRIFLGTSAGRLFISNDSGATWTRFAHLGIGDEYVLDHIVIDPQSGTMFVSAWTVEHESGDVFRSANDGVTWQTLRDLHGRSVRALAIAPSDPHTLVAGALDGVFRSVDGGDSWQRISPAGHLQLKNIESLAIDANDRDIIYAGTWHLPWKTEDGGLHWHSIKDGVIDDSDVFSIILTPRSAAPISRHLPHGSDAEGEMNEGQDTSNVVYLSACSGIYKSENAGSLFHKIHGIPKTAQRTRMLKQDPSNPATVYAGTTEGLWKTVDAGLNWQLISSPNLIVNDVLIDPRDSSRVVIATDRAGVLASSDGGRTFLASNRGFAHRQVRTVLTDRDDPQTVYAGVVNDKEFGGVFVTRDGGQSWKQLNDGMDNGKLDIFALSQTEKGDVVAGTSRGIYVLGHGLNRWEPRNTIVEHKELRTESCTKGNKTGAAKHCRTYTRTLAMSSKLEGRVSQLQMAEGRWFASSSQGVLISYNEGRTWFTLPMTAVKDYDLPAGGNENVPRTGAAALHDFIAIEAAGRNLLAIAPAAALVSRDLGDTWRLTNITYSPMREALAKAAAAQQSSGDAPSDIDMKDVPLIYYGGAITPGEVLWIATREGAFRSRDLGATWERVFAGLPEDRIVNIAYDSESRRLFAVAGAGNVSVSTDNGDSWQPLTGNRPVRLSATVAVRGVALSRNRLLGMTNFDGVVAQDNDLPADVAPGSAVEGKAALSPASSADSKAAPPPNAAGQAHDEPGKTLE